MSIAMCSNKTCDDVLNDFVNVCFIENGLKRDILSRNVLSFLWNSKHTLRYSLFMVLGS